MAARTAIVRLLGALGLAYLLVLQAAAGGVASAGHVRAAGDAMAILCVTSPGDEDGGDRQRTDHRDCCSIGCLSASVALAAAPEPLPFAYDPRPTPLKAADERDRRPATDVAGALKRPRGPPLAG